MGLGIIIRLFLCENNFSKYRGDTAYIDPLFRQEPRALDLPCSLSIILSRSCNSSNWIIATTEG